MSKVRTPLFCGSSEAVALREAQSLHLPLAALSQGPLCLDSNGESGVPSLCFARILEENDGLQPEDRVQCSRDRASIFERFRGLVSEARGALQRAGHRAVDARNFGAPLRDGCELCKTRGQPVASCWASWRWGSFRRRARGKGTRKLQRRLSCHRPSSASLPGSGVWTDGRGVGCSRSSSDSSELMIHSIATEDLNSVDLNRLPATWPCHVCLSRKEGQGVALPCGMSTASPFPASCRQRSRNWLLCRIGTFAQVLSRA